MAFNGFGDTWARCKFYCLITMACGLLRLAEQSFEDAAKILMLGIAEEIVVIYPTTWIVSVGAD
ncbi:MAG: hypothetical protein OSB12_08615 [Planctomycetota bacterium]|nr:hypothetical protein [Planctomycetota bacterium]